MYIFTLWDMEDTVRVKEEFKDKPPAHKIQDLLLCVDTRYQKSAFMELMAATGELIEFSTVDEDGFEEDEDDPIWDGVYATLEFVEGNDETKH